MPPWRKLQKLGKSAMDGAFSPFATWMSRRGDPVFAAYATACPKGGINGCISLVTFFVQAKKVTRPYQTCLVRSHNIETGETMPPALNGWWAFSPVLTLHSAHNVIDTGE